MTGAELKSARTKLGLSAQQLADALEMMGNDSKRTIRKWEAGTVPGPVSVAVKFMLEARGFYD